MGLKQRLERIEEAHAAELAVEPKVKLVLGPDYAVEVPAEIYPDLRRRIELIYGDGPEGERLAA